MFMERDRKLLESPNSNSYSSERDLDCRLGVYVDAVYQLADAGQGRRISTDRSFLLFVSEVGDRFDALVVFGRTVPGGDAAEYVLPDGVELVALPHYSNLRQITEVLTGLGGTAVGFWRGLARVDVVWAFGPHPLAVLLICLAVARRKRVVLGVRQNSVDLYSTRIRGWKRVPAVAIVRVLDGFYRLLARHLPVTVQGAELADRYGGERPGLLTMTESIVRQEDLVAGPPDRPWPEQVELLTVGRLEPEKNPLLLVEALARLNADEPGHYRLTWVGRGPLEETVRRRAAELGVEPLIEFHGYVPFDQGLLDLYRRADVFVHVSMTEGMPKVLIEALASGTPIVATDVGGVRAAMHDGAVALLVPPDDRDALVHAVQKIASDPALREMLVTSGLEVAQDLTIEAQAGGVVRFIDAALNGTR
jgi:glycosyltransferase involved in cell wall biosynthesis